MSSNSVAQDSSMPTSSQLSTITKKRNRISKSKTPTPVSTNRSNEPGSILTNLLQELNEDEVDHSSGVIKEDIKVPYQNCCYPLLGKDSYSAFPWASGYVVNTYVRSGEPLRDLNKKTKSENNAYWHIPRVKLIRYAQFYLQDFSFDGICLTENQISLALELLELVFTVWSDSRPDVSPVPLWHGSDSQKYCLQQAMSTTLDLLSYNQAGNYQSMTLVGNLVLSGSKFVYHQRLHHMPKYIEWLLGVIYSVGDKTLEEYAQKDSLI
ncbi:hypothetical protein DSO57_1011929 [Entomophthora muscae]|uniref:Uncharacterized protein n=1 Tax=Entomophthora muscae TaxID=34485 RepID=A0ACC2T681_9FUNG|nr:hypothetical protein DSO57_1011929 [Entomophthora muscae]